MCVFIFGKTQSPSRENNCSSIYWFLSVYGETIFREEFNRFIICVFSFSTTTYFIC